MDLAFWDLSCLVLNSKSSSKYRSQKSKKISIIYKGFIFPSNYCRAQAVKESRPAALSDWLIWNCHSFFLGQVPKGESVHDSLLSCCKIVCCVIAKEKTMTTSVNKTKFAKHGRKMATYDQSFNEYWGWTRQSVKKFVFKKYPIFLWRIKFRVPPNY